MKDFKTTSQIYDTLWAQFPEVERKGKTMPYTSMNGNMYSFVSKVGEMAFRLSDLDHKFYIENHGAQQSIQHERVMRGYINVPEKYFTDTKFMTELIEKSIVNARTLKPKPTKKKKK